MSGFVRAIYMRTVTAEEKRTFVKLGHMSFDLLGEKEYRLLIQVEPGLVYLARFGKDDLTPGSVPKGRP
jgi:hypothetical protein